MNAKFTNTLQLFFVVKTFIIFQQPFWGGIRHSLTHKLQVRCSLSLLYFGQNWQHISLACLVLPLLLLSAGTLLLLLQALCLVAGLFFGSASSLPPSLPPPSLFHWMSFWAHFPKLITTQMQAKCMSILPLAFPICFANNSVVYEPLSIYLCLCPLPESFICFAVPSPLSCYCVTSEWCVCVCVCLLSSGHVLSSPSSSSLAHRQQSRPYCCCH